MDTRHRATCGTAVIEARLRIEEYGMVAKNKCPEYDGGPQQPYDGSTNGVGTIEDACGIRYFRNGLEWKSGANRENMSECDG